jgi:hypothetical protein
MFEKSAYCAVVLGVFGLLFPMSVPAQKRDTVITPSVDNTVATKNILTPADTPASVKGRVTDGYGRGISNVRLTVFNVNTNAIYFFSTNTFGYYRFLDLPVGDFYVMSVQHKRYLFIEGSVSFMLDGNMTDVDFQASN